MIQSVAICFGLYDQWVWPMINRELMRISSSTKTRITFKFRYPITRTPLSNTQLYIAFIAPGSITEELADSVGVWWPSSETDPQTTPA